MSQAVLDLVLGGLGWLSITPVPIMGMYAWKRTMRAGRFEVVSHPGVSVTLRRPLLPYEASGTGPTSWMS